MTLTVGGSALTAPQRADVRTGIGLGNVDNTSDANKPVSTATAAALAEKLNAQDDVTDIEYGTTGLSNDKVVSYVKAGVSHTVSYPDSAHIVDVGGGVTMTVTLDGSGRPIDRIYT